eukprot:12260967-Prorocentrum_lima.AAC.1
MEVSKTLQVGLAVIEDYSGYGTGAASVAHIQEAHELAGLAVGKEVAVRRSCDILAGCRRAL